MTTIVTWAAIVAWIESGRGGFVGIHSAADTQLDFEGGEAAVARINVEGSPQAAVVEAIRVHDNVLDVQVIGL